MYIKVYSVINEIACCSLHFLIKLDSSCGVEDDRDVVDDHIFVLLTDPQVFMENIPCYGNHLPTKVRVLSLEFLKQLFKMIFRNSVSRTLGVTIYKLKCFTLKCGKIIYRFHVSVL